MKAAAAIDGERLWRRHMALAEIGATGKGGVNRQALGADEARARALLAEWAGERGYRVSVDGISNLFVRREGTDPALAPVLTGSHIDSQPTGGRFDGAYGVLAALEALQALDEAGIETARPIEAVAWLNEEGSRFAPGMMGSEAFCNLRPLDDILAVTDRAGVSVADELPRALAATPGAERREIGFPVAAFVEAHIEQGPALERAGLPIGVVTGIQGVRRMRVRVTGEEAHAGTTPPSARRDALWEAARMIDALQRNIHRTEEHRFTVGMMEIRPNVPSVVASEVLFSIDIRHPDSDTLARLEAGVAAICRGASLACDFESWTIAASPSIRFDDRVVDTVEAAAADLGLGHMRIFSGAGHDARQLSHVCPTGMIFVPCEGGISHNEAENATPADLADGARVLAETLVRLAAG
ncbi:MAG: Zn-dependent hydrolase [Defluviicoccus sp.]|nr:Zn-dependent hydrolase [Defluviicoccus sp.]